MPKIIDTNTGETIFSDSEQNVSSVVLAYFYKQGDEFTVYSGVREILKNNYAICETSNLSLDEYEAYCIADMLDASKESKILLIYEPYHVFIDTKEDDADAWTVILQTIYPNLEAVN